MDPTLTVLLTTAVGIAFLHTLIGVDHILPFVVLGKANGWPMRKTLAITCACGTGHVLSSVALGVAGIWLGTRVSALEGIEATRGTVASWALIAFGLLYAAWALAVQRRRMRQAHQHAGHGADPGVVHVHSAGDQPHRHDVPPSAVPLTVGGLFVVFVLGPCEPLIPLLMIPAATMSLEAVVLVTVTFGAVTVGTMMVLVALAAWGLTWRRSTWLERHIHIVAGLATAAAGAAILLFGI